jgi:hypothetical protein
VAEPVIERDEVVALRLNVSDIVGGIGADRTAAAKKKLTDAERARLATERERVLANAARTRELAERAQAKLDASSAQR